MRMFVKNSPYPLRDWEKEHVVAECIWPVGHSHPNAVAGDESTGSKQHKRRHGREHGKSM